MVDVVLIAVKTCINKQEHREVYKNSIISIYLSDFMNWCLWSRTWTLPWIAAGNETETKKGHFWVKRQAQKYFLKPTLLSNRNEIGKRDHRQTLDKRHSQEGVRFLALDHEW